MEVKNQVLPLASSGQSKVFLGEPWNYFQDHQEHLEKASECLTDKVRKKQEKDEIIVITE